MMRQAFGSPSAIVVAGLVLAVPPQAPTFSARIEAVRLDVLVTDRNRPVLGLRAEDFEVSDNGVLQRVDLVDPVELPLNLVLVFDATYSVAGEPLAHLQSAGGALLGDLTPTDQAALIAFSDSVSLESPLTHDFDWVRGTLSQVEPVGGTPLVDACFAGLMVAESDVGRSLEIVFTDGLDTSSWLSPDAVTAIARQTEVVVYPVVAAAPQKAVFLRDLAEATGGRLIMVESTKDLGQTFHGILQEFRQRYVLAYSPQGVNAGGWHHLDVRVRGRHVTVKTRPGYVGATPK